MGVVYEAWDPALGRTIALKTVGASSLSRSERKAYEKRFLTEARAAARLSHPGIVVVHDVGRDSDRGLLYIALERLEGETLADRIASGRRLEWREALRIVGRVAQALHHAHTQGVVHRDVKPANIMILPSGEPKIMDFGIARVDGGHLTTPGELFGTPLYMAPEQALGRPADARSDLFSLGTIAYTLLTSRAPFAAPSVPAILARVAHRAAPPPSELVPGLPVVIDDILLRAMAKAPENRYPTGQMMAEDIEDVLGGRPPRHRAAWTPAETAGRTIAGAPPDGPLPELDLVEDAPPAPPPKRGRWRSRLHRLELLVLALAAGFHFWTHPEDRSYWLRVGAEVHRRLSDRVASALQARLLPASPAPEETPATPPVSPSPEASPAAPSSEPTEAATPPDLSHQETPAPSPEPPMVTAEPEAPPLPSPSPPPTPTPSPPPTPPRESPPPRPQKAQPVAWLSIGFEHHLASGTLEVWVDDERVAQEALDSRVTHQLLGLELRSGSLQQTLGLAPGKHEVRVRLRSGDEVKTARSSRTFRAGTTRRLEVKAPRLRSGLTLEWK
jgi:serine/threonine-protein kinase